MLFRIQKKYEYYLWLYENTHTLQKFTAINISPYRMDCKYCRKKLNWLCKTAYDCNLFVNICMNIDQGQLEIF